jgi:hypothetical protein
MAPKRTLVRTVTEEAKSLKRGRDLLGIHHAGGSYPSHVLSFKLYQYFRKRPLSFAMNTIKIAQEVDDIVLTLKEHQFDWNSKYFYNQDKSCSDTSIAELMEFTSEGKTHPDVLRHFCRHIKTFDLRLGEMCRTGWKTEGTYARYLLKLTFLPETDDIAQILFDLFFEPAQFHDLLITLIYNHLLYDNPKRPLQFTFLESLLQKSEQAQFEYDANPFVSPGVTLYENILHFQCDDELEENRNKIVQRINVWYKDRQQFLERRSAHIRYVLQSHFYGVIIHLVMNYDQQLVGPLFVLDLFEDTRDIDHPSRTPVSPTIDCTSS